MHDNEIPQDPHINDSEHVSNDFDYSFGVNEEILNAKEEILILIASLKHSVARELEYFQLRTRYSLSMIMRGTLSFIFAIFFVLIAFISLGVGMILIFEPVLGLIMATLVTFLIFLSLSTAMFLLGRSYYQKLSFPELSNSETKNNDRIYPDE